MKKILLNGVDGNIADFNNENLSDAFVGADTMILISMPFVGPKRRAAQKTALDAAVKAGVNRLVYTSIVGAGEKDIDTYEVNDHVWFEAYVKEQPIHYLFLRDSQYAEAMVSNSTFTNDFEELTGRKPMTVREMFEDMENHLIGSRTSTDE